MSDIYRCVNENDSVKEIHNIVEQVKNDALNKVYAKLPASYLVNNESLTLSS